MENFDQIFTLLAEHEGISLNTDILETGLLNIIALVAVLLTAVKDVLSSGLEERQLKISNQVEGAEYRVEEAEKRLAEAKKQLAQVTLVISEIKNETIATKKMLLESDADAAKRELEVLFDRASANLKSKERQFFLEIKQGVVSAILDKTRLQVLKHFYGQDPSTNLKNHIQYTNQVLASGKLKKSFEEGEYLS